MKNVIRICIVIILTLLLSSTLKAQNHFAQLEKNNNTQAKGLIHHLNKTNDTLILKSDKIIYSFYTMSDEDNQEFDIEVYDTTFKFPLNRLSKGRHVLVAKQSPTLIVFAVNILKDFKEEKRVFIRNTNINEEVKLLFEDRAY